YRIDRMASAQRWARDPRSRRSQEESPSDEGRGSGQSHRFTSVRSADLSGLDVDKDILLAILRRLDLDHVDILAFLPLDRHRRGLAGDLRDRNLRRLVSRDLRDGRRILQPLVAERADAVKVRS